jgi:hypothetical protein
VRRLIPAILFAAGILACPTRARAQQTPTWPCDEKCKEAERSMIYVGPPQARTWTATITFTQFKSYLIVATVGRQYKYLDSCDLSPSDIKKKYTMPELQAIESEIVWVIFINKEHNAGVGVHIQQAQKICQQP